MSDHWDAIVIGAGVAGSVTARALALRGHRTLLIEAKQFPRDKVCGGCLSARGVGLLRQLGLGDLLDQAEAVDIDAMQLVTKGRVSNWALPLGKGVSRRALDQQLLLAAQAAGVEARLGTRAEVLADLQVNRRVVRLVDHSRNESFAEAKLVIAADGLGHPALTALPQFTTRVTRGSRVGLGTVVADAELLDRVPPRQIVMVVGRHGYVGLARCEQNQISVAAAVDPRWLARLRSPGVALQAIVDEAGWGAGSGEFRLPAGIAWHGTRPLTQRSSRLAGERLFVVGDAASYVEPFTGEGMTSALAGAWQLAPLADAAVREWSPSFVNRWQIAYHRHVATQQRACRLIARMLRSPTTLDLGVRCATSVPFVARSLARHLQGGAAKPHQAAPLGTI